MYRFDIPTRFVSKSLTFAPERCDRIVVLARDYGENFVDTFVNYVNNGGFAKTSDKSFPVFSKLVVFEKAPVDSCCLSFDDIARYNPYVSVFECEALENGTCLIPEGIYPLAVRRSSRFGCNLPYVLDVPKRTGIMIHPGNYARDSRGCILPGMFRLDNLVSQSSLAVDRLMSELRLETPESTCLCVCTLNNLITINN